MSILRVFDSKYFYKLGCTITNHDSEHNSEAIGIRRFRAFFGCSPVVCSIIWSMLQSNIPDYAEPLHLLWSLNFLKQYNTENCNHRIFLVDEKTFRKWTWVFVNLIASLKVIKFENRFQNSDPGVNIFTSIDGTDYRIHEPTPFNKKWFSHKFKSAGVRYEIALCIKTGYIVWANGPYPCGAWPDLKIARHCFIGFLNEGEKAVADLGYRDKKYFLIPNHQNGALHKIVMSRHETVNRRLKQFGALSHVFRHSLSLHSKCFYAVTNIVQLEIENGSPLFQIP